jgi:cysteine-rich repeat protein
MRRPHPASEAILLRSLIPIALLLVALAGCSDDNSFAAIESARLVANPSAVTFNLPGASEGSAETQILLTNAGGATLTVQSVTVVEGDEVKEVDVVDADDWAAGGTEIASGDSLPLRLQWTVRDATIDTGTVTIVSTGGEATVTFQTLDIDPVLVVTSDPPGTSRADGLDVALVDAPPGTVRPVALTLTSDSIAALTITEVCLLDDAGECHTDGSTGEFSLCEGQVGTLRDCQTPEGERALQQNDNARLTVLYRPEPGSANSTSARVQISSNAAQTPRFTVTVRGTPCADGEADCLGGAPVATIEAPTAQQTHYEGMDIELRGVVSDGEDAADGLRVWWLDDGDALDLPASASPDGVTQGTVQLTAGPHFLSLFVEDSDGNIGVDGVAIVVDEPNLPPAQPTVDIAPDPAVTGDSLTASASGAIDPEGDAVEITWQWQRDGEDTEYTGTEVPAQATTAGQTWTAIASASDAFHPAVVGSASVAIENTPPTVDDVTIRGDAFTNGTLVCEAEVSDPDGAVIVTYSWRVGGETYEGNTLDVSQTGADPGDTITCVVLADDGGGGGVAQLTASITLANRRPRVLSVAISPQLILQDTQVTCAATAEDADGDVPSLSYAWTINAQPAGQGATLQLTQQTAPVAASLVCTVTATDAFDGMDMGFDTATVLLCDRAEARSCNPDDVQACRDDGLARVVVDTCGELGCENGACLQGCGDGVLEDGEACDDGDANSDETPNACRTNCELPSCGDSVTDDDETCDDGNDVDTDSCVACALAFCGDGFVEDGEETCDDGDNNDDEAPNACRTDCEPAGCGDGVVDDNEGCDDGNDNNDDACDNNCDAPFVDGDCRGGAVKLGGAPNGGMIVCKDEGNQTCEQDFGTLCPADWHLCTMDEFNRRNDGWDFPVTTRALGVIFCRPGGGAGHFTVPDSAGLSDNLGTDERFNCYYGSSRPSCTAGYGCNEREARALCCAPQANCGNGVVDHAEEQCDDGNADNGDDCLNNCAWRLPTEHGFRGTNCN